MSTVATCSPVPLQFAEQAVLLTGQLCTSRSASLYELLFGWHRVSAICIINRTFHSSQAELFHLNVQMFQLKLKQDALRTQPSFCLAAEYLP